MLYEGGAYEASPGTPDQAVLGQKAYGGATARRWLGLVSSSRRPSFNIPTAWATSPRISPDNWVHDQALLDRPRQLATSSSICSTTIAPTCALSAIPAVLPRPQAADAHRVGQERQDLSRSRERTPIGATCRMPSSICSIPATFALEDKLDEMAPLIRDFSIERRHRHPDGAPVNLSRKPVGPVDGHR